ncbi:MAG: YggT family protein [Pseudomonadota bacterium]
MDAASNIFTFLISTLFSLYIGAVLIRIILAATRADFYNPISQFIVTITNPTLIPLRKILPSIGKIDTASWTLAFLLKILELFILLSIKSIKVSPDVLIISAILQVLIILVTIFLYAVLFRAILSWFPSPQMYQNPLFMILTSITEPLLRPARRIIPPVGAFDLSALAIILVLYSILIALRSF